jgi:ABC-type Na+ efflux pump permease subunit
MMRLAATLRLGRALTVRCVKEQGKWIVLNPVLFAGFFVAVAVSALLFPHYLTGPTRHSLEVGAQQYGNVSYQAAMTLALLLNVAPYFLPIFGAMLGSSVAQNLVGNEVSRGGIELLLSAPYSRPEILLGLLLTAFSLTAINWLGLGLTSIVGASVLLHILHVDVLHYGGRLLFSLTFPLPLAYLSSLIAMVCLILYPRLAQVRTGSTNLLQLFAMLPSVVLLLVVNLFPHVNPVVFASSALLVGFVGSVVGMTLLARIFNPAVLLAS